MTNIQAALGLAQLEQIEHFIETKRKNYEFYKQEINKIHGLKILEFKGNIRPNYWFYSLYIDENYPLNRDELIRYLASKKIQTRPIWGLISEQKPYKNTPDIQDEKAYKYLEHVVNIPCSSNLQKEDAEYVVECLKQAGV